MDYGGEFFYDEDRLGMRVSSGAATIQKDAGNLIGISIGGGAALCPCLYVVQVFDNTPASKEGSLEAGDELTGVNKVSVKGKTKTEVARMIQAAQGDVLLQYNKLHADPKQGKSLDIVLKKAKHKMIENMSADTADALGLSRAILCNDSLVKKMQELERNAEMYRGLMEHSRNLLRAYYNLSRTQKKFGDIFAEIGAREPQKAASEAFTIFGEAHRNMDKQGMKLLRVLHPMLNDLSTYLNKAIPDTKLTIKKYLDVKFEYLSYCLKLKEMDDEESQAAALQEPLYRVETGNYEYRLILRCRQDARVRFARLRQDVMVKMELLDQKHVQDISFQLQRFVAAMARFHVDCKESLEPTRNLFPIEVDLSQVAVKYNTTGQLPTDEDLDEEELEIAEEATIGNGDESLLDLGSDLNANANADMHAGVNNLNDLLG
uniref:PRKCA-binding protein n=1 Tax=Plectus sambesii TaxID=2011161 RepID=A0A914WT70_9BILA